MPTGGVQLAAAHAGEQATTAGGGPQAGTAAQGHGDEVKAAITACKAALAPGTHGIGRCVSAKADQQGKVVSASASQRGPQQGSKHASEAASR